jgi:hypothetical protein
MHLIASIFFVFALVAAIETMRHTIAANGNRILDALAGVTPETLEVPADQGGRVLSFDRVSTRPAYRAPDRLAA